MRSIRGVGAALAVFAAGAAIGACGGSRGSTVTVTRAQGAATGSPSTPAGATGTSAMAKTATSTSTSAPTTSTATGSATSSAAATPACTASTLALSEIGNQGATGHIEVGLAFKNTGSQPCHTYGYPGVQFLGRAGRKLPTTDARTTVDFAGHIPLQKLVVAPGEEVSFRLLFQDSNQGTSNGCTTAYGIQAIPPDDTHTLTATIPHGVPECGTTSVSPLAPGTSAYSG